MKLKAGTHCPLLDKECIQFKCAFWTQLRGSNPQTGGEVDEWACAIAWLPILLIENAKEVRQGAAATESFRNEVIARVDGAARSRIVAREPMTVIEVQDASSE